MERWVVPRGSRGSVQTAEPAREALPGAQLVQFLDAMVDAVPPGHAEHAAEPLKAYLPESQPLQYEAPLVL